MNQILKSLVLSLVLSLGPFTSHLIAQIDITLIGIWEGTVTQLGIETYPCLMTIDDLVIDQVSGETVYPDIPCTAENVFLSNTGDIHQFSEAITNGSSCLDGTVEIYKLTDNSIQFDWYFPGTTIVGSTGVLNRIVTGVPESDNVSLSEVYPNPFTHEAFFELDVNQSDYMSIELYNQLSTKVQTIYQGEFLAGQKHRLRIDGSVLSSGIYYLKVLGSGFQTTRRLVLTK